MTGTVLLYIFVKLSLVQLFVLYRGEDGICSLNIPEMLAAGLPDEEVLTAWLTDLHFEVS
jgi:hypothetical protein